MAGQSSLSKLYRKLYRNQCSKINTHHEKGQEMGRKELAMGKKGLVRSI